MWENVEYEFKDVQPRRALQDFGYLYSVFGQLQLVQTVKFDVTLLSFW
jgi:hypothetical protein